MKVSYHLAAGIVGSAVIYKVSDNSTMSISYLLANSLIDIDHLFDYYYEYRKIPTPKKLFEAFYALKLKHSYLLLHSYEILAILWLIYFLSAPNAILLGINSGLSVHLIMDQLKWGLRNPGLFLLYRFARKFILPRGN